MSRMSGSARTIWIMAVVAVVSLAAGLGLSRLIVSPAEAAANAAPPEARAITVPVERRLLANDVVLRGDVVYEDPVDVTVETGDLGGPAIVTGAVPQVGTTVDAGSVLLEVAGRPVIALTGALPVYRTLRAGASGPDVVQLKEALGALGIDAGDPGAAAGGAVTARAVGALYDRVGYPVPSAGEDVEAGVELARDAVESAEQAVRLARAELTSASRGSATHAERVRLQAAVDTATVVLAEARALCDADPASCRASEVTAAEGALNTAIAERDGAGQAPDTSSQRAAVTAAERDLDRARADLATAQSDALTPLPAGEVVYLSTMPRRVDAVTVERGATLAGTAALSVSGATLQVRGTVPDSDAGLLQVGAPVTIALPDDGEVPGTITSVGGEDPAADGDAEATAGRTQVVVTPGELTEEQRTALQGQNVRVNVPVSSTAGEVLAVPLAALTAGPGGEARVEVLDGDDGTLVEVTTGLAADGFVEVTAVDGALEAGDRVVVGQDAAGEGDDPGEGGEDSDEGTDEADG
jgi:multidrug efflux pump subunit AcrA (membrane-fusion protein)